MALLSPRASNFMCTVQARKTERRGFTLLEVTLAVAILALMSLAIYRFVQSNIRALRISSQIAMADDQYQTLEDFLTAQLESLPSGAAALSGEPFKLNDTSRDEMKWTATAGLGLLTRYAADEFTVTLRLQPEEKDSTRLDLGLLRKPKKDLSLTDTHESWVLLIKDVRSMQIRYFDPRINAWLTRWTDTITLPRLVKIVIQRNDASVPWEAIIPLGRTPL
jgi:prepilin-type N-terminal cleavage/methylation domain-containing protein